MFCSPERAVRAWTVSEEACVMCSPLVMEQVRCELSRRRVVGTLGAAVVAGIVSRLPADAQEATPVMSGPGTLNLSFAS
jgi:hypothetical protein